MAPSVSKRLVIILTALAPLLAVASEELNINKEYIMDDLCDDVLDMERENITSGSLIFTDESEFNSDEDCWLTIRALPDHRLVVSFTELSIEPEYNGDCDSYVEVFDGSRNRTGLTTKLCGTEDLDELYVTSTVQNLSIHFYSDFFAGGKGFSVMFTSFYTGPCRVDDFLCDSGYCVDGRLNCSPYACGDGSVGENCVDHLLWTFIGIGIFGLCCAILACFLGIPFLMHKAANRKTFHKGGYVIQTKNQETMPINAPSQTAGASFNVQVPCPEWRDAPPSVMSVPTAPLSEWGGAQGRTLPDPPPPYREKPA